MKQFEEFLKNNLKMNIDNKILPEVLNYLSQLDYNVHELTLRNLDNKTILETKNGIISIYTKSIDNNTSVIIEEKRIMNEEGSIFNNCEVNKAIVIDEDHLDVSIVYQNAENYYTGSLWSKDNNTYAELFDSEELKSTTLDLTALDSLYDEIKANNLIVTISVNKLDKELNKYVKNHKEIYNKSIKYKKNNR